MLSKLVPRLKADTIYDIPLDKLWENGIRGIITDLDNTLVGARVPLATPELVEWLKQARERGFQIVIVSNNNRIRVSKFAEPIVVPFISGARKPFNRAFVKAMGLMELEPAQVAVVGDQMLTDVLGGNRIGLFTVMVNPIAVKDEGFFTRINRRIEKLALRLLKENK